MEDAKLWVLTFSVMLSGIAGALYIPQAGIINPTEFAPLASIEIVIWVAVGGMATLYGAVIGAMIFNYAKSYLTMAFLDVWVFAANETCSSVTCHDPHLLRLMLLVSPSLPTGAFAYSQGLEWAIEARWVQDGPGLRSWLIDLVRHSMAYVDIPLLVRMMSACGAGAESELARWCDMLLAMRESQELRME